MKIFEPLSEVGLLYEEMLTNAISYQINFDGNKKPNYIYNIYLTRPDFIRMVREQKDREWYGAMGREKKTNPIHNRSSELKHTFIAYHEKMKKGIRVTISVAELQNNSKLVS